MKILLLAMIGALLAIAAAPAVAQPGGGSASPVAKQPRQPRPLPVVVQKGGTGMNPGDAQANAGKPEFSRTLPHSDRYEATPSKSQPGMALLFWIFALVSVGGALFVISRKNLIAAVMGMVGSFIGISAIYMMLYANFLAVIQMLVYAGAIMVLFVFVIMILNRPEDEPVAPSGRAGQAVGGLAIVYLIGRLVMILIHVQTPPNADIAPSQVALPAIGLDAHAEKVDWGSVKAVGMNLFGPGLFPFEAISILLLVAVVGAIAIARPTHHKDDADKAAQ